jgi:transcriptional regulator with XRE-family HTH domain
MPIDAKTIGANIRARREHLGYTQAGMARRLGVTQPSYAKYESGAYRVTAEDIAVIADALRVSVTYIYGEDDARTPDEIRYEPIFDALHRAASDGGLGEDDTSEVADIIIGKARRRAEKQGRK